MLTTSSASKWAMLVAVALGCASVAGGLTGCAADGSPAPNDKDDCLGTESLALKTCAGKTTIKGIDVSYYQGTIDWTSVKSSGTDFAFARVSDGTGFPDTKFAAYWPAMKKANVVRGFYQFFRPNEDVTAQVNLMVSKVNAAGGFQTGDLPPVLDLEVDGGLTSSQVVAHAKEWLTQVEAKFGIKPIVYTAAFMSDVIGTSFGAYRLWVANYGVSCPTMPSGWTDWHFWQNADNGNINGISASGTDTNLFNGDLKDLMTLTLQAAAPASSKPTINQPDVPDTGIASSGGDQGATLGSSKTPDAAPFTPCHQ